jgi:peptidoglycan/LPS O-acetylase OafA/YrhL/lysophospholipase L1-like esterase
MDSITNHLPSPVKFREDINGLRAWAVIGVLLFHFSLIGLPGGFAGVDVFFVISGYLMTAIIVNGHEKGSFSIWKFYMSRIRRIIPALLVVIAVLLILGWFYLPTIDYQSLGEQSYFGMTFLSNIHYWRSSGYFDSASHEKWLLHTWSLAVEAQFYVLYPLFIALVWKFWKSLKAVNIAIVVLFVGSLVLNLYISEIKPSAAFYLLPTRCWELASGGLVFLAIKYNLFSNSLKNIGYWLGWILIIGSFSFISEHLTWPSYWAMLPVLGTSLVMLANKDNVVFTNNYVTQWVGDRSYSLYLWHWPIVVALYFSGLQNNWTWVISGFGLSILLAQLSYRFVEVPTRQYLTQANLKKEVIVIGLAGLIIGMAAVSVKVYTFEGRLENQARIDLTAQESTNQNNLAIECSYSILGNSQKGCIYGLKKEIPDILFIGDSFGEATVSALTTAAEKNNKMVLYLGGAHGCAVVKGFDDKNANSICPAYYKHIQNKLKDFPNTPLIIITSARYFSLQIVTEEEKQKNLDGMRQAYKEFSVGRTLFITYPIPVNEKADPKAMSRDLLFKRTNLKDEYNQPIEEVLSKYQGLREYQKLISVKLNLNILDPMKYLCDDKYCYGSKNGRPLYYDGAHLSEYGNKLLVPMFEEIFKDKNE